MSTNLTAKKILTVCGSTRSRSSNLQLIEEISRLAKDKFDIQLFAGIDQLPHFNPDLDDENPPISVCKFRDAIFEADGFFVCTPEYIFSLPGTLKNALDWLVSTTVLSNKPTAFITASSSGEKAHEELQLILQTLQTTTVAETQLLISGIRSRLGNDGRIQDPTISTRLDDWIAAFEGLLVTNG